MVDLDSAAALAVDESGMFGHIARVGDELMTAWAAASHAAEGIGAPPRQLVVAGIGGSATAADYFAAICRATSPVPVEVVRGPLLPHWVGPETLVVACSYSGNTEETLAAATDAAGRGAGLVAITRGGRLAEIAAQHRSAVIPIAYDAPPRATTVHTLAPLLRIGNALGLCAVRDKEVASAARSHAELVEAQLGPAVALEENGAKRIASALVGRFPWVVAAGHLAPAAFRFKNQLAENGKLLAAADSLPEAGHNLVVGLDPILRTARAVTLVTLESASDDAAMARKFEVVQRLFGESGAPQHCIKIRGESLLDELLQATAWGDYVSCYVALARGIDPTPIPQIETFRAATAG